MIYYKQEKFNLAEIHFRKALSINPSSSVLYCHVGVVSIYLFHNRPFPSCFEPRYESEAKCKVFIMKLSFRSYANKTNFPMKSFAL